MISSSSGRIIFISELLQSKAEFNPVYQRLLKLCRQYTTPLRFLGNTNDIWCRDYMPVQVREGEFIQFNYNPSYLKDSPELRTNAAWPFWGADMGESIFSSIKLDGGNVISNGVKTLISSRVFDENPEYEKHQLIKELEELLETEVVIIPQIRGDMTGHIDGMVRFVNKDTLVGNHRQQEYKYWRDALNKVLKAHNFHYIDFPFETASDPHYPESAVGCYLNYIELATNLLFFPVFGIPMDDDALILIEQIFPGRVIEPINMKEVANHGGVLNCITWTVAYGRYYPPPPKEQEKPKVESDSNSDILPF